MKKIKTASYTIAALEIGMQFLAVTYGFGFKNEEDISKYCPMGCASSPMEIYPILIQKENIRRKE